MLRSHRHQHAANVRVTDDAARRGPCRAGDAALHALARIGARTLIRALGDAHALHADAEAREVHHHEHVLEAAILLADDVTDGTAVVAECKHRGRAAWMPSLCSSDTQRTSLRAPRLPSAFTRNFGTTNSEMPLTPGGASGVRASTRWMMLSV